MDNQTQSVLIGAMIAIIPVFLTQLFTWFSNKEARKVTLAAERRQYRRQLEERDAQYVVSYLEELLAVAKQAMVYTQAIPIPSPQVAQILHDLRVGDLTTDNFREMATEELIAEFQIHQVSLEQIIPFPVLDDTHAASATARAISMSTEILQSLVDSTRVSRRFSEAFRSFHETLNAGLDDVEQLAQLDERRGQLQLLYQDTLSTIGANLRQIRIYLTNISDE